MTWGDNMHKDVALSEWLDMTRTSGCYNDLTDEQRNTLERVFRMPWFNKAVRGTYEQRFDIMNAILFAFFKGAGI